MKKKVFLGCLTTLLFSLNSFEVSALTRNPNNLESYYFPYVTGNILTEYSFDSLDRSDYGNKLEKDKRNLGYLEIESNINFYIMNRLSIKTKIDFRPVMSRVNDEKYIKNDFYGRENYLKRKYYFNKYDIVFEELALEYKEEQFMFGMGKYNPTFATAYDKAKYHGVFDTRIVDDYALTEKIGFYVAMTLPMVNLRLNSFYKDDTFLSKSLFGRRDRYKVKRGAANTGSLDNFSLTADFATANNLKFNLGIRRLGVEREDEKAERGYVFGMEKLIEETSNGFGFIPFGEIVYIENYDGIAGRKKAYATARLPIFYGGWSLVGTYSFGLDKESGFKDYKDYLAQITLGYKFDNGLMLDVSKSLEKDSYKVDANNKNSYKLGAWGVRLSYMVNFDEE